MKLTYRQILKRLNKIPESNLDLEFRIFDLDNDSEIERLFWAMYMEERQPAGSDEFTLVILG